MRAPSTQRTRAKQAEGSKWVIVPNNTFTTARRQQHIHNSASSTAHSQQRVVNSTFTTARRQQHIHNSASSTAHLQQRVVNSTFTTARRQQHIYNSTSSTAHSQQRVVNSTFTTARRQQHIHNKTLPDIIMKRVYGSKRDGNAKGLTFLELAQTIHICVHTAYVQQFWQENYSMHKHVWYKCTVLANPNHTL